MPTLFSRPSQMDAAAFERQLAGWLLVHAHGGARVAATHREIAADPITARDVVSRRMKVFARQDWIVQERGWTVVVAPAALSHFSRGSFVPLRV